MKDMIMYRCPKCDYTMAAKMVIGEPKCEKCGIKLEKVAK